MGPTVPEPLHPFPAERAAERWVRPLPRSAVLAAGIAAVLAVGLVDWAIAVVAGYDFVVTVLYILPVGFVAWAAGQAPGMLAACLASVVELGASFAANRAVSPWVVIVSCVLELLVFLGAAHTMALLRNHLEYERLTSLTDPLTGVGNARAFRRAAERELARTRREPAALSLAYVDLDGFKAVNDTRGHAAGDELLSLVGRTLVGSVRSTDLVARLGGDEFAILLPHADASTCRVVVERLREGLAAAVRRAGPEATFSIGAATFPSPAPSVDALLGAADSAMYEVKRTTKDGVRYAVVQGGGERR